MKEGQASILRDTVGLAQWVEFVGRSPMQDALPLLAQPEIISFALGLPSPELFPTEALSRACSDVLSGHPQALQYGVPSIALKSHIVSLMRSRGVECNERQIVLTCGAQQAVSLIVALLLDRRREVIAEEMCYPGFRQVVNFYQPEILEVPTDRETGMDVDRVEWLLKTGACPAFIYAIPNGHNPIGVNLSQEKRSKLLEVSRRYNVPIIEEDPYGFLSYEGGSETPLRAVSEDLVFYVGSFSKMIAPSLRLGWLIAPEKVTGYLAILKEASDIDTTTFAQHIVACMLESGFLWPHLRRLRAEYQRRRNVMLAALPGTFPRGSVWSIPRCGFFLWVRLPDEIDTTRLLKIAANEYRVAFMPGMAFCGNRDNKGARSSVRLNFSNPSESLIEEGMLRLGSMFGSHFGVASIGQK
jgi:2-aminoadipate transaminase